MNIEPLTYGAFYHIYNRGNNSCDLFREEDNYRHFLALYERYIVPVADTFAWVLMPNHFHLLVRIKMEDEIGYMPVPALPGSLTAERPTAVCTPSEVGDPEGGLTARKYRPANQFSHLFNAYAQHMNRRYHRTGSLFEHPFRRKKVEQLAYLKNVVRYIHQNPVHHGFCSHPLEYPWSSYLTCTSSKPSQLKRDWLIGWFDSLDEFVRDHQTPVEHQSISDWLAVQPDYYTPAVPGTGNKQQLN